MDILEQLDEIFGYFKPDCNYAAITGTIWKDDIDTKIYEKQTTVGGESFDHIYEYCRLQPYTDDLYTGTTFIPIGKGVYARIDWSY